MIQYMHSIRPIDRRGFLAGSTALLAAGFDAERSFGKEKPPATGRHDPALQSFDDLMFTFVEKHDVPGAALAVSRHGKLVYARGFGWADVEKKEQVKPASLFRIASVSKPITAVAVLHLMERGKLKLDTKAFEFLGFKPHLDKKSKPDPRLDDITIQHLLNHTAGWDREKTFDPMCRSIEIAKALGVDPPAGPVHIIRWMMGKPLQFDPGKREVYSNFGYCVLGRVIEKASGISYQEYVKKEILTPIHVKQSRLGKTLPEGRAPGEVVYYDSKKRMGDAVMGKLIGKPVALPYGTWCLEALDSHGGWISSAVDLVCFASAFDYPAHSKILSAKSIHTMFARPPGKVAFDGKRKSKDSYYACGWQVVPVDDGGAFNAFHSGLLDGTSSILVRRFDGLNWAVLFNTHEDSKGKNLCEAIDPLVHEAADKVKSWPNIDLFEKFAAGPS